MFGAQGRIPPATTGLRPQWPMIEGNSDSDQHSKLLYLELSFSSKSMSSFLELSSLGQHQ
jgi:hypothetical protein